MASPKIHIVQSKDDFYASYERYKPILLELLDSAESILRNTVTLHSSPTFKSRIKCFESYYRKVLRVKPESLTVKDFPVLTDLLGVRIICPFLEDLSIVEEQIKKAFSVIEVEKKGQDRSFSEFGYESIHILMEIPSFIRKKYNKDAIPKGLVCEIQIRTILQDAWAEVEHELVYKSAFSPFDLPLRRKLAAMNASLSLADITFQEIRGYQKKLNSELDKRRESFYHHADLFARDKMDADFEITKDSPAFKNISGVSPYVKGTIDDMILEAIHAQNIGKMDLAIHIYTQIIKASPSPNDIVKSVIYKHRGMAYFAKNMYEDAISDFDASVKTDPNNYHSMYYLGIVKSVLNNENEAIECFNKSLLINPYQAHVNYRKALSLFHTGRFQESFETLNEALKFGFNDSEAQKLRDLLLAKFENEKN